MAGKVYSYEEIVKHNTQQDLWVLIAGKVYNVTNFLDVHPGGDIILYSSGKDATSEFEEVGHSSDAQQQMKEFYIGDVDKSTLPAKESNTGFDASTPTPTPTPTPTFSSSNQGSSKILLYILPLLILGVAFLLRFYSKKE